MDDEKSEVYSNNMTEAMGAGRFRFMQLLVCYVSCCRGISGLSKSNIRPLIYQSIRIPVLIYLSKLCKI